MELRYARRSHKPEFTPLNSEPRNQGVVVLTVRQPAPQAGNAGSIPADATNAGSSGEGTGFVNLYRASSILAAGSTRTEVPHEPHRGGRLIAERDV